MVRQVNAATSVLPFSFFNKLSLLSCEQRAAQKDFRGTAPEDSPSEDLFIVLIVRWSEAIELQRGI
jgi:hypothetical protein